MEKEMERGKNLTFLVIQNMMVNIFMVKELNVKNILEEIQNMKEIIYLADLIMEFGMIKMVNYMKFLKI